MDLLQLLGAVHILYNTHRGPKSAPPIPYYMIFGQPLNWICQSCLTYYSPLAKQKQAEIDQNFKAC